MDIQKTIKHLGLSDQETLAYLALLKIGGSQASSIAKEVGVKRTTVYAILQSLAKKGFVRVYFRDNHRFYYAEKPHRVAGLASKKLEAFEQIIPVLNAMERSHGEMIGLRYIETKEELEEFYRSVLQEHKNKSYRIISSAQGWEGIDPTFFIQYRKDRGNANIKTRLLLSADSKEINPADPALLREYKYLPEKYKFRSTLDIYENKILVVSPDLASLAVVIAIPAMTDIFGAVFEILWDAIPFPDVFQKEHKA